MIRKFGLLAVFAIAMAHVEGVVVVYLRKVLDIDSNREISYKNIVIPKKYLFIERTREVATIVMLLSLALVVSGTWLEGIIIFLWTFAFWDLFYYVSLYLLIKWPPKLTTIDILFLIPSPWIAPVWVPVSMSLVTIIVIIIFFIL